MKSNEAIRAQINGQTKQVAADLDKSESTVFKYQQNGEPNPLEIVLGIIKSQPGSAIAQLVAVESGGFFIRGFDAKDGIDFAILPKLAVEFGEFMIAMGDALQDGKITIEESTQIKWALGELVGSVFGFLNHVGEV